MLRVTVLPYPPDTMPRPEQERKRIAALGGAGRAKALTPQRRQEIARAGYKAMMAKKAEQAGASESKTVAEPSAA